MFPDPIRPTPMKATLTLSLAPRMLPVKRDVVSAAAPAVLRKWRRSVDSCAMRPFVSGLAVMWACVKQEPLENIRPILLRALHDIAVVHLGLKTGSRQVLANLVRHHHRSVLAAGTSEGDGQVTLSLAYVMRQ